MTRAVCTGFPSDRRFPHTTLLQTHSFSRFICARYIFLFGQCSPNGDYCSKYLYQSAHDFDNSPERMSERHHFLGGRTPCCNTKTFRVVNFGNPLSSTHAPYCFYCRCNGLNKECHLGHLESWHPSLMHFLMPTLNFLQNSR